MENFEKTREKGIVKTSVIGIVGNIFLVIFKAFVGLISNSVAIFMDAVNNLTDALSSIITIIGTKLSNKKPTKKHPYGYGRIEYITSMLIGAIILFAGGSAMYESIGSLIEHYRNGKTPEYSVVSIVIISAAVITKIILGLVFIRKSKKYQSESLRASGYDALFDSILSFSTLIGILMIMIFGIYIEGYISIVISLFILKTGFDVERDSVGHLIGEKMEEETGEHIKERILEFEGVYGVYDLILYTYGKFKSFGSVHIGIDEKLTANEIQTLERNITYALYKEFNIIMTIGIYVDNNNNEKVIEMKKVLSDILVEFPNIHQIHGFYLDEENKIIGYDLVVSVDDPMYKATMAQVNDLMAKIYPDYKVVSNIDFEY